MMVAAIMVAGTPVAAMMEVVQRWAVGLLASNDVGHGRVSRRDIRSPR
jgi:hypothetical protein